MRFHVVDRFLTAGSSHIPADADPSHPTIAAAIACSSQVDAVEIHGMRLTPMGIVPAKAGWPVVAVRTPMIGNVNMVNFALTTVETLATAKDATDDQNPGELLVLVLFEQGDDVFSLGPRSPVIKSQTIPAAAFTANSANNPVLALRMPFSGRRQCTFWITGSGVVDCNIVVRGVRYTSPQSGGIAQVQFDEAPVTSWFQSPISGGASVPASQVGGGGAGNFLTLARVIHVGGNGDSQETYDELQLLLWGAAQGVTVIGEAFGERVL